MCQIQDALAALIPCWWHKQRVTPPLVDRLVVRIAYTQKRNRTARVSHAKATRRRLRNRGLRLTDIKRCRWGPNMAL